MAGEATFGWAFVRWRLSRRRGSNCYSLPNLPFILQAMSAHPCTSEQERVGVPRPGGSRRLDLKKFSRRPADRPSLTTEQLLAGGFDHAGDWHLISGNLKPSQDSPRVRGVYAFVKDNATAYVGVATMGLAKRLYFYGRPGASQRTSLRIGAALRSELEADTRIAIYTATPPDLDWNGLPVAGDVGLELGLIQTFRLPWDLRGA